MSITKVTYSMIKGSCLNVLDYGAVADGNTDDTAAIQSALVAACALGGKAVFFPAGIYKTTGSIYCGPNTTIIGEGTWDAVYASSPVRGTVFKCLEENVFVFYVLAESELPAGINWPASNNPNSAHSVKMENFTIWGANTTQRGIVIGNTIPVTQIDLQNITMRDCLIGVDMKAAYGINIRGVYPRVSAPVPVGSKGFQIGIGSSPTSGSIENCFVFSCETGIYVHGAAYYPGFAIKDIDFDGCRWGVMIGNDAASGNIEAPNMFQNLGFENIKDSDIYVRVAQGNIGIRGYLIATAGPYAGPNIDVIANTGLNLYLSDGRTVGAVTGIQSSANVTVHTSNWEFGNAVSTATNKHLQNAEFVRGTWTPSLVATGGGSFTYAATPVGEFIKIGKLVFVSCNIQLATNSGTGNLEVHGLPFTVDADGCQAPSTDYGRVSLDANYSTLGAVFAKSTTKMYIFEVGSGSTISTNAVVASQLQPTAYFSFSGIYITT